MTDNGIYLVDKQTGATRPSSKAGSRPSDLAVVSESGKDTGARADVFSYRTVDGQSGAVPTSSACNGDSTPIRSHLDRAQHVLLTSWFSNTVERSTARPASWCASLATLRPGRCTGGGRRTPTSPSWPAPIRERSPDGKTRSTVVKDLRGPEHLPGPRQPDLMSLKSPPVR